MGTGSGEAFRPHIHLLDRHRITEDGAPVQDVLPRGETMEQSVGGQAPPKLETTVEEQWRLARKTRLLNVLAASAAIICTLFLALMHLPTFTPPWVYKLIFGLLLLSCCLTLLLNRRGLSQPASLLFTLAFTAAIFAVMLIGVFEYELVGSAIYYFIIPVLVAGVVVGPRSTFAFATLSTILLAVIAVVALRVLHLDAVQFSDDVLTIAVPAAILCFVMAIIAWLYGSNLEGTLHQLAEQSQELRAANEEIRAFSRTLEDKVEERTHELRKFVWMVAHDLRSPLTAISGYTEILQEDLAAEAGEKTQRALKHIAGNVEHMVQLTDDLLELSRLRSGSIEFEMEPMPIDLVIEEVCTGFERQLADKHLGLKLELPAKLPPVQGDPVRLAQVLNNLVGNACNYTPSGAIIVGARPVDGRVEVSVSDTGIGIPPEELKQLFSDFFRGEHELVQCQKGSGLGLSIAHSIIEGHGGQIWVESEVDKGTTVHFTLPVATGLPRGRATDSASPSGE